MIGRSTTGRKRRRQADTERERERERETIQFKIYEANVLNVSNVRLIISWCYGVNIRQPPNHRLTFVLLWTDDSLKFWRQLSSTNELLPDAKSSLFAWLRDLWSEDVNIYQTDEIFDWKLVS